MVRIKSKKTASHQHFLGFRGHSSLSSPSLLTSFVSVRKSRAYVSCRLNDGRDLSPGREKPGERKRGEGRERVKARGKDNVWSVDNEMAKAAEKERERGERRKKKGKRVKSVRKRGKGGDMVMVSGSMLMEIETVLQTQVLAFRYKF